MDPFTHQWTWDDAREHYFVRILADGRLMWGGWEKTPRGAGGACYQDAEVFLTTGQPGYEWMTPPSEVLAPLREALSRPPR